MIRLLALIFLAGFVQGCAPQHYVAVQADTVTLSLHAPEAERIQFASSTDQYTLHEIRKNRDGTWTITGLVNKEFLYFYLVDGKMFVPECRFRQNDDFGTTNCRYLP